MFVRLVLKRNGRHESRAAQRGIGAAGKSVCARAVFVEGGPHRLAQAAALGTGRATVAVIIIGSSGQSWTERQGCAAFCSRPARGGPRRVGFGGKVKRGGVWQCGSREGTRMRGSGRRHEGCCTRQGGERETERQKEGGAAAQAQLVRPSSIWSAGRGRRRERIRLFGKVKAVCATNAGESFFLLYYY